MTELKNGHIPDGVGRHMEFWKAEEFQKFSYPAYDFVLQGILPWILIIRITELIFNFCRSGWTLEITRRHNILTEEIENCTISLYCVDDIMQFSSPNNYWCYVFKRAVHKFCYYDLPITKTLNAHLHKLRLGERS